MTRANHLGPLSLLAATAGFAVMQALRHFGLAAGPGWGILQSGFEAGMAGGAADWFAVSALFRPIPSRRLRIWHTGLIEEKRAELSSGIVDMVQNSWLGPEVLAEHLGRLQPSRFLLDHLAAPGARDQVVEVARDLLGRLAGSLDEPEVSGFLDRALGDQLRELELGPPLGGWLEARILAGDTAALWDLLAGTLARGAEQGDFQAPIRILLETAAEHYRSRGSWENFKVGVLDLFFDLGQVSGSLSQAFAQQLRAIQHDPGHPLRAMLDERLLGFARKLAQGDPQACASLGQFQRRLVEQAELGPSLARILARLQGTLKAELADPDAHLSRMLDRLLDNLLRELEAETDTQARLDVWVRHTFQDLAMRNHAVIGEMVAASLTRLSDRELVAQIEGKVGADLQYIRLNGAVVGGLVGVLLAVVRLLLHS